MRLIHTSDWHLGQLFYEYDRTEEHARFLAWLLDTLDTERADALLVAGDVFDHANPSAASQKQLYRFLMEARLRRPHLNIVFVAGNHDSPSRLEAPSPLLREFDIVVVGQVPRGEGGAVDCERLCVPLKDANGRVRAWCLAVPFLRSADLPAAVVEPSGAGEPGAAAAYTGGVASVYRDALVTALERREDSQPVVALGHCHVEGCAVSSDSERPVVAGGLDAIGRHVFDPRLAYVALGHLHRPQHAGGEERLRYSGSPMPLSFSEIDYAHQVVYVELDRSGLAQMREIRVPRFADLLRLPDKPAPLDEVIATLQAEDFRNGDGALRPYLEVRVRLDAPQPGLRPRIEEALADKPVRLARIETSYDHREGERPERPDAPLDDLARLSPEDIFRQRYRSQYETDVPEELLLAFGEMLRAAEDGEPA